METVKNSSILRDLRDILRREGYAFSTEKTYVDWVRKFIKFHHFFSREAMMVNANKNVEQFLTYLAVKKNVSPSTQNQALNNALALCYSKILLSPLGGVAASRSRKEPRIPVVLTKEEVLQALSIMDGTSGLITKLLYASGLRITEAVRLRVQDVNFGFKQITVRNGKSFNRTGTVDT